MPVNKSFNVEPNSDNRDWNTELYEQDNIFPDRESYL